MCDASVGHEGRGLCLILKELSGVMCYRKHELTSSDSNGESCNTNNSNWSELTTKWPAIPISR